MQAIKECPIFSHNPDALNEIRKAYNLHQPGRIEESIDRLQEWIQAQPHFNKKDFDRDYLEAFLINGSGSVERAKRILEQNFAIKTFAKRFFCSSVRAVDWKDYNKNHVSLVLPKPTKDHLRIVFCRNTAEHYTPNVSLEHITQTIYWMECVLKYSYHMGIVIILDYRKADLSKLFTQIMKEECRTGLNIVNRGYKLRVKNVHVICDSKLLEVILPPMKMLVPDKIISRVVPHRDLKSLHEYIDKDLLPSDYGGKEKTLDELRDDFNKFISRDEFIDHVNDVFRATIDTSKKPMDEMNDLNLEMAGTFRSLQVD